MVILDDNMQSPQILIHFMAIDTWYNYSPDEHYLPTMGKKKEKDVNVDMLFEADFVKLSCTNDDFILIVTMTLLTKSSKI